MDSDNIDKPRLKNLIQTNFSLEELKSLCFDLGILYDDIPGQQTINAKARELIAYCSRKGLLSKLIEKLQQERPHVNWTSNKIPLDHSEPHHPIRNSNLSHTKKDISPPTPESNDINKRLQNKQGKTQSNGFVLLILNAVLFAAFSLFLIPRFLKNGTSPIFCSSDSVSTFSLSIIMLFVFHLVWRVLSPVLTANNSDGVFKIFGVGIPIVSVKSIIDSIHPWIFPDKLFWGVIFVGIVICSLILSPFLSMNRQEHIPKLAHFSVFPDGSSEAFPLPPKESLQLQPGQKATIEAVIGILKGARCEWKPLEGTLTELDGCKVTYVAPQNVDSDFLELDVSSKCSDYIFSGALKIKTAISP